MGSTSGEKIYSQLSLALNLSGSELPALRVIDCVRVGRQPLMEVVCPEVRWPLEPIDIANVASHLQEQDANKHRLVLLCDLFADGNEPHEGVNWERDNRAKGAILGALSCLMILARNSRLRTALFDDPERLLIATIEDDKVSLCEGEGIKMVTFLRQHLW